MYTRTTERGWGKQGPEQARPWLPSRGPTKSEQTALFLWAVSTTGKGTEVLDSLTPSLSQAGLNAIGSFRSTTEVLLLGGQCGHFTGHGHQQGPGSESVVAEYPAVLSTQHQCGPNSLSSV